MPHPPDSKVFVRLLNGGPLSSDQMDSGVINAEQKQDGLCTFRPRSAQPKGSTASGGGRSKPVYYIDGKHSKKRVIEKWLETNEHLTNAYSNRTLHWRIANYGDEWKEASLEILGPFESNNPEGGDGQWSKDECPLCGERISKLPSHLPECEEA